MTIRSSVRLLLEASAAAVAVCAVGASAADASVERAGGAPHGRHQPYRAVDGSRADSSCRFSLDGHTWQEASQIRDSALAVGGDKAVRIDVHAGHGASCTRGSTWQTSGKQELVGFDTDSLARGTTDSLRTAVPAKECFAQIDLYRGSVKHGGTTARLPEGPDHPIFNGILIAAWHGGTQVCTDTPALTPPAATAPPPPP
ncbi:hypothetical protein [Streptomyces sp. NPDC007856]|uniref:hypothetical protein n=1 Tax=Streptomyces sp. NPDC007856 TaxID=3364781 RepID=UPI00369D03C6